MAVQVPTITVDIVKLLRKHNDTEFDSKLNDIANVLGSQLKDILIFYFEKNSKKEDNLKHKNLIKILENKSIHSISTDSLSNILSFLSFKQLISTKKMYQNHFKSACE